ncbi:MAG: SixA phosphatase family protein [Blastococcus sp.]
MQRRLLLIRHAQAAHAPVDADRPLNDGGAERAAALGRWLRQADLRPDRVVVSPAVRAAQTWERAAAHLAEPPAPITDERIYENTVEALLAVIQESPADGGIVAVVGHNPSVGVLASVLDDGEGSPAALRNLHAGFPPGGVAVFALDTPFDAVGPGTARLTDFTVPRA